VTHLGSFGAAVRELDPDADKDTFEFLGHTFTVYGAMPEILKWQLASAVAGNGTMASLRAAEWSALMAALTKQTEDDEDVTEFTRFYLLAVEKKANEQSLQELVTKLFEVQAGRPFEEPPGSSAGQSETSPSSNGSSSTPPDSPRLVPVDKLLNG